MTPNVPTSESGTATLGMIVARNVRKNAKDESNRIDQRQRALVEEVRSTRQSQRQKLQCASMRRASPATRSSRLGRGRSRGSRASPNRIASLSFRKSSVPACRARHRSSSGASSATPAGSAAQIRNFAGRRLAATSRYHPMQPLKSASRQKESASNALMAPSIALATCR